MRKPYNIRKEIEKDPERALRAFRHLTEIERGESNLPFSVLPTNIQLTPEEKDAFDEVDRYIEQSNIDS